MGLYLEDAIEGGGGTVCLDKFLLRGDTGSIVVWDRDLGVVGANGSETRWGSCRVSETGDEVEGKNNEGRFMEKGGGRQSASGIGDTTAP